MISKSHRCFRCWVKNDEIKIMKKEITNDWLKTTIKIDIEMIKKFFVI